VPFWSLYDACPAAGGGAAATGGAPGKGLGLEAVGAVGGKAAGGKNPVDGTPGAFTACVAVDLAAGGASPGLKNPPIADVGGRLGGGAAVVDTGIVGTAGGATGGTTSGLKTEGTEGGTRGVIVPDAGVKNPPTAEVGGRLAGGTAAAFKGIDGTPCMETGGAAPGVKTEGGTPGTIDVGAGLKNAPTTGGAAAGGAPGNGTGGAKKLPTAVGATTSVEGNDGAGPGTK